MASQTSPDPIACLLAAHTRTRQHLEQLLLAHTLPQDPATQSAIAWFDSTAQNQHHILRDILCPLLIESMAGSDAVCIKGMTQSLDTQGTRLGQQWRQLIAPGLLNQPSAPGQLAAWVRDYLAYLDQADDELLPMAARLLDDKALETITLACKQ